MGNVSTDRKEWAAALRKKIEKLTNPDSNQDENVCDESSSDQTTKPPESPRQFIERRMRELDKRREHSRD